jgi:hypothetical protein
LPAANAKNLILALKKHQEKPGVWAASKQLFPIFEGMALAPERIF